MTLPIGAAAFTHSAAFTPDTALPIVTRADKIGLDNLQWLLDSMPDPDIIAVGKQCRAHNIRPITVCVLFPPKCPTGDAAAFESARQHVLETARRARLLAGDEATHECIMTGPILRCLTHARKGGLPLPEDREKQVAFLKQLQKDFRSWKKFKIGIEPVCRTEACSLNTIGELVQVIDEAEASVAGVLGDVYHAHIGEKRRVVDVFEEYRPRMVQVHLSEVLRGSFRQCRAVTPEIIRMLAGPQWRDINITMESATTRTPAGFLPVLMVNDLEDIDVFDLYERDFKLVQQMVA